MTLIEIISTAFLDIIDFAMPTRASDALYFLHAATPYYIFFGIRQHQSLRRHAYLASPCRAPRKRLLDAVYIPEMF